MELPHLELGDIPVRHAHSCLSFSAKFFDILSELLSQTTIPTANNGRVPDDRVLLSVGSGTGLLERLLETYLASPRNPAHLRSPCFSVEGVEVQQTEAVDPTNKYLPEPAINSVRSSREISPRLKDPEVFAIMFVYPRQPSLLSLYISTIIEMKLDVKFVIWLGPVADWVDYESCLAQNQIEHTLRVYKGDDVGLESYEMMAVWES